ncbi:ThrRS/AlaRS common domain-containing protein [Punctularia strigosozonata HHB-11173 SS5]|uniref:ThrRS/AlaRS common domain-containing protein n=1 Tax=Punctularia strigosozonata (strain HHB-11173) TaxID=741275 RepID=UPI0004416EBB|nr:ThrRS/AlaRS common domain-containing protein [Punctularia strigosozonata HHB-11173 SS5]EIN10926.1 ThrRS/AlaRS common domain-containing protein [Punctularia strigosozonata HHB-11173 SS5]
MAASALLLPAQTPPTYHRIVSPTLTIPDDPATSIPVGLLACQRDPLLRQLQTTIVSARIAQALDSVGKKKGKKLNAIAATDLLLELVLHDTVLFPEGGGQPSDVGVITTSDGRTWEVVEAKRHGGHSVNYVKIVNVDSDVPAFGIGSMVTVALGEQGYNRRLDHMCMHTSQHLLSALLETRLNLSTLSWSLTAYPTPSYVEVPRGMTAEEIAAIQQEANKLVFEGRQVHVEVEELVREDLPDVVRLESGRAVGKALPDDYTGGVKRTVVIDGVDRNPCCGTHMPSLHNLQLFLVPHTEALSRSSTTSARLYFMAGPRLIAHLTTTHALLASAASTLSCGAPLVPQRCAQVLEERRASDKRVQELETELARSIAQDLVDQWQAQEGALVRHVHRTDDSANALAFLSGISMAFADLTKDASTPYLLVLSSSPSAPSTAGTNTVLVIGSDEKRVKEVGEALKAKLSVRGGGKGNRWSGKLVGVWKASREGAVIDEALGLTQA